MSASLDRAKSWFTENFLTNAGKGRKLFSGVANNGTSVFGLSEAWRRPVCHSPQHGRLIFLDVLPVFRRLNPDSEVIHELRKWTRIDRRTRGNLPWILSGNVPGTPRALPV